LQVRNIRGKRKREQKLQAILDPAAHAQHKSVKQARKKLARKRQTQEFKNGQRNKSRRKKQKLETVA
jgi:hypothetical protein